MKPSLSLNILRVGILLVLIGFFLPVGCDLSGYQIAQGIVGESQEAKNATLLAPIENGYGYALFGVFAFGFAGLVLTFALKGEVGYSLGFACLGLSLVLFILVALKFLAIGNSPILSFVSTTFNMDMPLMIGAYSIGAGFVTALAGFVLKMTRAIS